MARLTWENYLEKWLSSLDPLLKLLDLQISEKKFVKLKSQGTHPKPLA